MGGRFRSRWQQIKQHRVTILVVAIILIVAVALIIVGYRFDWTGFNGNSKSGKTLWDWLQLLIIPVVLAIGGYVINLTISRSEQEATKQRTQSEREAAEKRAEIEREIALDNQREAALQAYIDKIAELLLEKKLRESKSEEDEVRKIARVRTLTVLPHLDPKRKGSVLRFLIESNLIDNEKTIIDLGEADLSGVHLIRGYFGEINLHKTNLSKAYLYDVILLGANLSEADLSEANLTGIVLFMANLYRANLHQANLLGAELSKADLSEANLQGTDLCKADMSEANLKDATGITLEELEKNARSLKNATMPDGSKHP
jgi:uncharacterized protein YjbI with pentapeptide repeats